MNLTPSPRPTRRLALGALAMMLILVAPLANAEIECFDGLKVWVNRYYEFVCIASSDHDCVVCVDGVDACETAESCQPTVQNKH